MKLLITIIFVFISLLASAQVKTGGGSVAGPLPKLPRAEVFDKEFEEKFDELTKHLVERELICRESPEQKLIIGFDFMQTYSQLSFAKSLSLVNKQCQKTEIFLKCLSDEKTINIVKSLVENFGIKEYMLKTYNQENKEIEGILNFLKTMPDSYCPKTKASCEM